jgi:hypothetical protein
MSTTEDARDEHKLRASRLSRLIAFLSTWSLFIVAAIWAAFIAATL